MAIPSPIVSTAANAWIPSFLFVPERMAFSGIRSADPTGRQVIASFKKYADDISSYDDLSNAPYRTRELSYTRMDLALLGFPELIAVGITVSAATLAAYMVKQGFDMVADDITVATVDNTYVVTAVPDTLLYYGTVTINILDI
jgi:hypothetical protein